jgi:alkylation response protein AidB-like acyl-CoA dehydrogenase
MLGPMLFDLDDETRLLQRTVRDFAEAEIAPVAEDLDRHKRFPADIVRTMGELGLMGIPFPEEVGGSGGTSLQYAIAVEELARVDSSVAITMCAHTSLGTQPVHLYGTPEQRERLLPDLCAGRKLGAFGLTEPDAGSDAANVRTRADLADGVWTINGAKQFITNAGTELSGHVAITAVTGEGTAGEAGGLGRKEISNLIVENGTPGYEQGEPYRKMGWHASDTRPLTFTDVQVPEENLLGPRGQGFKQFLHILDIGRIGVAAMGVGLAQGALEQALAYARERRAFGQPISKFQTIQAKLADMATEIEAARLLTYKAAWEKDEGRSFTLTAAQAKLKTGRLAVRAAEEAVQIHGGYGYIEEYPVCRFYRDAKILTIGEGTDEVQQMVIARALGA